MLRLNLPAVMRQRGITNPVKYLLKKGFSRHRTGRLLRNEQGSISYKVLEKLCVALHCTPNDLLEWEKTGEVAIPDTHPLHQLLPRREEVNLLQKLQQLPLEKLEQLKQIMKDL
ncbi:MAG: helix-turn-helix domain-containing protein [Saprospiraceae bacterium]